MRTIKDIDISKKRVFIRVDFNVPLDNEQRITDDARIAAVLPTLKYALSQEACVILASHLGRPKGQVKTEFSLQPVARRLGEILGREVMMAPDCIGEDVTALADGMESGQVLLLENLRFHQEEQQNDSVFGKSLAAICDVYINDAFAVSHRANASVVSITEHAPISAAGMLLKRELDFFDTAMKNPVRPLVAIVGGAKISSKLSALKNMLQHVDKIIVGGAMANTFIKGSGCDVGRSMIEEDLVDTAADLVGKARERGVKFYMPVDVVAADRLDPDAALKNVPVQEIPPQWLATDIGPATSCLFSEVLQDVGTIIWNGPMGVFEMAPFSHGTFDLARAVGESKATSIIGGGETGSAVKKAGTADQMSYISTGGGAFLTLMEGQQLVAVAALERAASSETS
ncbi:MAG: phosphoglycerate kinase [Desulfobacterales bacterium]|nr:phosphoglycerate kinase [Desulfobacterales bacterium]MDX2511743.1 phosphoglycerate kinase [Desulfobacterales bacterium]